LLIRRRILTAIDKITPDAEQEQTIFNIAKSSGKRHSNPRCQRPRQCHRKYISTSKPRANILGCPNLSEMKGSWENERKEKKTRVKSDGRTISNIRTIKVGDWCDDDPIRIRPSKVSATRKRASSRDAGHVTKRDIFVIRRPLEKRNASSIKHEKTQRKSRPGTEKKSKSPKREKKLKSSHDIAKSPVRYRSKSSTSLMRKKSSSKSQWKKKPSNSA
jgi:hypothetical protein